MLTHAESWREFIFALRYLAELIGTDTPAQLRTIARALSKTRWNLPDPDPTDENGSFYGYPECFCKRVVNELIANGEGNMSAVRALLDPLPGNTTIKKMCYVNSIGNIIAGYELAAVAGSRRRVAIFESSGLNEDEIEKLFRNGYSCLFVKKAVQSDAVRTGSDD
jgi:hypothetical protein